MSWEVIFITASVFFFNVTATTESYTLSLHDALPICAAVRHRHPRPALPAGGGAAARHLGGAAVRGHHGRPLVPRPAGAGHRRSEEHTSELQSRQYLVCRLLLEKNQEKNNIMITP